ncbi:hypothetical protein OROGR_014141 [Orobanche gracilis]
MIKNGQFCLKGSHQSWYSTSEFIGIQLSFIQMLWGLVGSSHQVKVVVRFLEKDQAFALSLSLGNVVEALLPIKNNGGNGTRTQK